MPVSGEIKQQNAELKVELKMTNKRLDDVNIYLADQSRRIDDTNKRIEIDHIHICWVFSFPGSP